MLDQTTQNVSATEIRGKLGFQHRDESALGKASNLVIETLEEYGHEVDDFKAKRAHRVTLECDSYLIEVRHRRTPSPLRKADGEACRCQMDVIIRPRFPEHTDEELTELLMARILHRLLSELAAETVEWLDSGIVLERDRFLEAFAPEGDDRSAAATTAKDIQIPIGDDAAAGVTARNPRRAKTVMAFDSYAEQHNVAADRVMHGEVLTTPVHAPSPKRSRFAPIEETVSSLDKHCDLIIERRNTHKDSELVAAYRKMTRALKPKRPANAASAWVLTAVMAVIALPLGITAAAVNFMRGGDMRFSLQMLVATGLLVVLQSSELVHAALH